MLDLPLEQALAQRKASADRLESRGLDYFAKVRDGFRVEAERRPECIRIIDATASEEVVQARLRLEIDSLLASRAP